MAASQTWYTKENAGAFSSEESLSAWTASCGFAAPGILPAGEENAGAFSSEESLSAWTASCGSAAPALFRLAQVVARKLWRVFFRSLYPFLDEESA